MKEIELEITELNVNVGDSVVVKVISVFQKAKYWWDVSSERQ